MILQQLKLQSTVKVAELIRLLQVSALSQMIAWAGVAILLVFLVAYSIERVFVRIKKRLYQLFLGASIRNGRCFFSL